MIKKIISGRLIVLISLFTLSACSNQPQLQQLDLVQVNQSESADWQKCKNSATPTECEQFVQKYPGSYYHLKALKKIYELQAGESKQQENVHNAALERIIQRDSQLPVDVRRDKYMVALTAHLKNERYSESLQYFELLERLNTQLSDSFHYFYGEALLKTGQPNKSIDKLYAYITKAGSTGKYYQQALELVNEAELTAPHMSVGKSGVAEIGDIECPTLSEPLFEKIPFSVSVLQDLQMNQLICSYGKLGGTVIQLAYPTGTSSEPCTNPRLQFNPKLKRNYQFNPVTTIPGQEVSVYGLLLQGVGGEAGLYVKGIYPDSPADKAGLVPGDHILNFNGNRFGPGEEQRAAAYLQNLDQVSVAVIRDDTITALSMEIFSFTTPQTIILQNENVLGNVTIALPSDYSDTQAVIDEGKRLLDGVKALAISCP